MELRLRCLFSGSSVATSLSEGEAIPKHIGLLSINGDKFKMQKILLKTVRPFVYNVYNFKDSVDVDEEETNEESMKKAKALIEEMLEEAKEQIHNGKNLILRINLYFWYILFRLYFTREYILFFVIKIIKIDEIFD